MMLQQELEKAEEEVVMNEVLKQEQNNLQEDVEYDICSPG